MIVTNYALKMRTAVLVFAAASVLIGISTYLTMPREGAPDITIPYVFVNAPYPGVAPAEIENLVTIPLEKKFKDLENVKEVRSTSSEGISSTIIEFTPKEDLNNALQRVKDKIDLAKPDLPNDLDQPIVDVINFGTFMPVYTIALSGEIDAERLRKLAEDMKNEIENVPGVKEAAVVGTRERQIRVEIDPARLVEYKVSIGMVMGAVAAGNKTISAGNLEMKGGKFQVRLPGEFALVSEMKDIVVAMKEGRPVYLTDVASVSDTFKDLASISRLNGKSCVSLQVRKRSGENTLKLIKQIKGVVERFHLPRGVGLTITNDQSEFIGSMVAELENSMVSGCLLVIFVLLLSMGWRNSIFVGMAIPLSMFISFVIMAGMGTTLNFVVLFGLVMAAGMLVDDAVVIVENIFRNRSQGLSKMDAAIRGSSEVAWPVTTSTVTAALFLWPLLSWPDIMGQFLRYLPLTLILTRMASLFVALIINPTLCSYYITPEKLKKKSDGAQHHPILDGYESFMRVVTKHRVIVTSLGVLMMVLTLLLYGLFNKGMELFPDTEPRRATVEVKYPQGTHIEKTDAALRQIEQKLFKYKDIKFFQANAGLNVQSQQAGTHIGNVAMEFLPAGERKTNTLSLVEALRDDIGQIPGAEVKIDREKHGPPGGAPVSIEISGDDFGTLAEIAGQIMRSIRTVPGLVDLQDDLEEGRPEFQLRIDRARMALLGLNTEAVGTFLRAYIYGIDISKFRAGEDEYDITVRLPADERNSADMLNRTSIPLDNGHSVPLSSLGKIVYTGGRGDIMRKNQKRVITITAEKEKERSIDAILGDVRGKVQKISLPQGYAVTYSGENKDMNESSAFLMRSFAIGSALVMVILVMEFNSVILPVIIFVTVILAMMGVMWGLLICRMKFGVIASGLGVLTLAGVVVNNGIVLIDCIIHKRAEGMSAIDAAIAGGRQRLRPVLLTAIAAILGLIPMAVGWNIEIHTFPWKFIAGAETRAFWAPMAIAVIFGLTVATILTLVFVPVMYSLAEDMTGYFKRRFGAKPDNQQ
jgi:multidrug efflux pump